MAHAHHDAARDHERRRREPEFLGAHQRADHDVAPGLQLPVDLDDDAIAQSVEARAPAAFRRAPSSHGTPPCLIDVSGDAPVPPSWPEISTTSACAFATPAATVPTPDSATSFTRDPRPRVRVLQVVNQLRQVLDRIDVVVRRRRDQADAGRRVADLRDPRVHLVARQLPAFAGLGALRHLDLQVVGVHQVLAGDAEPRRRDLLDRAAARVAVGVRDVARRILAALAGVRLAAEAVHRDRERLVRLPG